jgi:hypothetical protein
LAKNKNVIQLLGKKVGDGFSISLDTECCGKLVSESKFTDDGIEMVKA